MLTPRYYFTGEFCRFYIIFCRTRIQKNILPNANTCGVRGSRTKKFIT